MPVGTEKELENTSGVRNVDDRQLVIFKIAGEEFGVDINEVKEIIRWTDVTRIPNTESYIKGVINLRGSIVVVNDLAMKLGLPSKEIDDDTRILVVEVGNNTVGMIVDSATEVLRLDAEKVKDAPSMITSGIEADYIDGVGVLSEDRLLTLLDLAKVMESKDFERILAAQHVAEQNISKNNKDETTLSEKNKNDSKEPIIK
jgi:purine-binding chemotaxis protein CheW